MPPHSPSPFWDGAAYPRCSDKSLLAEGCGRAGSRAHYGMHWVAQVHLEPSLTTGALPAPHLPQRHRGTPTAGDAEVRTFPAGSWIDGSSSSWSSISREPPELPMLPTPGVSTKYFLQSLREGVRGEQQEGSVPPRATQHRHPPHAHPGAPRNAVEIPTHAVHPTKSCREMEAATAAPCFPTKQPAPGAPLFFPAYATAQNVEGRKEGRRGKKKLNKKNPLDANLAEELQWVCMRRQFQQSGGKKNEINLKRSAISETVLLQEPCRATCTLLSTRWEKQTAAGSLCKPCVPLQQHSTAQQHRQPRCLPLPPPSASPAMGRGPTAHPPSFPRPLAIAGLAVQSTAS